MKVFKIILLIISFLFSLALYAYMFQHGIKVGLSGLNGWPVVLFVEAILVVLLWVSFADPVLRLRIGSIMLILQLLIIFRLFMY